jgi:hypothetical protein
MIVVSKAAADCDSAEPNNQDYHEFPDSDADNDDYIPDDNHNDEDDSGSVLDT